MKYSLIFIAFIIAICSISCRRDRSYGSKVPRRRKPSAPKFECDVSKEEVINAAQELFLVGDPDMLLPEDHCDIIDHCDNVEEKAKMKLKHVKCLEHGSGKLVFGILAKGYLKENEKRCSSKEWREKFLCFSDCVRTSTAAADIHQCGYKLHDAFQYAIDNFDVDHQLQFACCVMQKMDVCIHSQLIKDCGDEIAEFAPELFWEPVREAFTVSCPGIESISQCRKMYPTQMKDVDAIFSSNKKLSPRNFLEPGYKLHENRGERLPEHVPTY